MILGNIDSDDFVLFFFFLFEMMIFGSLKMNEAWANAPSLKHKSMSLEKNLI